MFWTDKGSEFISKHFKEFLKRNEIKNYITLRTKRNQALLKDGIKQSKTKCGRRSPQTTTLFTGIR